MMDASVLTVFVVDCLVRLLPTTAPPENPLQEIVVWCAQNEYEAVQIGIRVRKEADVAVSLSASPKRAKSPPRVGGLPLVLSVEKCFGGL